MEWGLAGDSCPHQKKKKCVGNSFFRGTTSLVSGVNVVLL